MGAVDAGGSSWRCAVMDAHRAIHARAVFPTTSPETTLNAVITFFKDCRTAGFNIGRIGVACFGPLAIDPTQANWGSILDTTKPNWSYIDVAGILARGTGCHIMLATDVTAAALAERAWGAGQGLDNLAYVTVGTGVGAGIILNGQPITGALHPEAGHIRVPRHPEDSCFPGVCPFHGDCVEGLASSPALAARWGRDAADLEDDHIAWDLEAHYLAHLAANLVQISAVNRVIFGGGVCERAGLVEKITAQTIALVGHYGVATQTSHRLTVVRASLRLDAGLLGGGWLALQASN